MTKDRKVTLRHRAYIGVGSNIGNKAENCRKGIQAIHMTDGCAVQACSPLYETEPVYLTSQDWFVNGVARISTDLEPEALFQRLKAIEREMGRRPAAVRYGPRILDLDILFYDNLVWEKDGLQIPHPRVHERRFVLQPLNDVEPNLVHPVLGRTINALLSELNDGGQAVRRCDS